MIKNTLLPYQLTDNQQLLIGIPTSCQKACAAGGQAIDAGKIALEMAELLLDRFADLENPRAFLLGHGEELLPCFLSMRAWLMAKGRPDLRMHSVDQSLGQLSAFIEQ